MIAKLSTTIEKIKNLPNSTNSITLNEFLMYMKNNGSSERHQNNNLIVMIVYVPISIIFQLSKKLYVQVITYAQIL